MIEFGLSEYGFLLSFHFLSFFKLHLKTLKSKSTTSNTQKRILCIPRKRNLSLVIFVTVPPMFRNNNIIQKLFQNSKIIIISKSM